MENPHTFQILTYRQSALLYAVAPDLDQLSVLEAQLNKKKDHNQHLTSKNDSLKQQNRNTENKL